MRDENQLPATPVEQMIVYAARLLDDWSVVAAGTQWPLVASLLAKSLHAPHVTICYEGGVVLGKVPDRVPILTGDPAHNSSSVLLGDAFDGLGMIIHAGRADITMISGASMDRFGNVNTTCIGDYHFPQLRFGGSGGACDFGSLSKTIIIMEHDKRRFPERVDFITTPGFLNGKNGREEAGLRPNTGPYAVVTTLGLFHFDENGELTLSAYHPSSSVAEVKENVQWDLKVREDVHPLAPPTQMELEVLRNHIDPQGVYLKQRRFFIGKEIIF